MTPCTGNLKFGEMEFGEMKRNTSNWSNFCMLLRRVGLSASAGLSCFHQSYDIWSSSWLWLSLASLASSVSHPCILDIAESLLILFVCGFCCASTIIRECSAQYYTSSHSGVAWKWLNLQMILILRFYVCCILISLRNSDSFTLIRDLKYVYENCPIFRQCFAVSRKLCKGCYSGRLFYNHIFLWNYMVTDDLGDLKFKAVVDWNQQIYRYCICCSLNHRRTISTNVCHIPHNFYDIEWLSKLIQATLTSPKYPYN